MSSFTCISCRVEFKDAHFQREHYKSDWHRYNLKRKVVELPPLSAVRFQERVLEQRSIVAKQEALRGAPSYCECCRKKFNSVKAFENHQQSYKHQENLLNQSRRVKSSKNNADEPTSKKEAVKKIENEGTEDIEDDEDYEDIEDDEDDENVEAVSSDEWEDEEDGIPIDECLFCQHKSRSCKDNLSHMSSVHSFFIPDAAFVIDIEGLVTYLGKRVGQGHMCMWCGHLGRQFPSPEAVQKHMLDKGHCRMFHEGEVLLEYSDFYDYSSSYPDEGDPNEEVETNVINDSGFELVLPSGATIGHRSLNRYYRQKLSSNPKAAPSRSAIHYGNHFKALGWSTSTKEIVERKARDMTFMRKHFLKNQLGVSVKANKLQKHFRLQYLM